MTKEKWLLLELLTKLKSLLFFCYLTDNYNNSINADTASINYDVCHQEHLGLSCVRQLI